MDKITTKDGQSADIVQENIEQLKALFPDAFTENGVDFDVLRQLLGDASVLDADEEKYGLTWHGKKKARQIALAPSMGTLLPCPEESVDWDTTENLFIEGDNLECLKLLRKSYANEVKLIYIDPPYNTGKEFIYPDKYQENLNTYLKYTGQIDDEGMKFSTNTETGGRKHSNWLSMMYPRLLVAKSFLSRDGAIFISIDENEVDNVIKLCDEIFGAENKLGIVSVVSNLKGRSDDKYFATAHNYLVAYSKGEFSSLGVELPEEYLEDYPESDDAGRRYRLQGLRKRGSAARREDRPKMFYPFYVNPETSSVSLSNDEQHTVEVLPRLSDGSDGRWRWGKESAQGRLEELTARTVGAHKRWDVFQIDYAGDENGNKRIKPKSVWMGTEFANEAGTLQIKELFGKGVFDNPKPVGLLDYIIEQCCHEDLILDFFAGSSTTGHAVFANNASQNRSNRFILVQLPEPVSEKTEAAKAGYSTISELSMERLRRAATVVKKDYPAEATDLGFKVFKLAESNISAWNPDRTDLEETLLSHREHLIEGRTEQDVLYELLLKRGVDLAVPIEKRKVAAKTVYSIGSGVLFACLDSSISRDEVEEVAHGMLAWHKDLAPETDTHVFFRDSAFNDDNVAKTNMVAILEQNGITHVRSL